VKVLPWRIEYLLPRRLTAAGFEQAMLAALMAEPVLAADESPVQVVTGATDPDTGELIPGSPHVLAIRTPDERLAWLAGLTSRSYDTVIAALRTFAGHLIVDGYGAYQRLITGVDAVLAGIQQCCQHVMRRCRGVAKLGPGSLQSWWTGQVTDALTEAHTAVQDAKADHRNALNPELLAELRERYDKAVDSGIVHNRHRDWHTGNHPGYTLPPGSRPTPSKSGISPHNSTSTGPRMPPNAASNPPNDTKPSPATGRPTTPSTAGA